jgi:hypothetical protein
VNPLVTAPRVVPERCVDFRHRLEAKGAEVDKDWNERFERGQSSHRPWLALLDVMVFLGTLLTTDTSGRLTINVLCL